VRRRLVLVAAASALIVSCGGDDDDGGGEGGGEAAGDYCEALADFKASSDALDAFGDDATPEQLETAFTDIDETLDPLVAAAPEEIKADAELLASSTRELVEAFAANDFDLEVFALDEGNQELVASLDSEEFNAAGERFDAYGQEQCGITIDD
jgi:hypothetical protein